MFYEHRLREIIRAHEWFATVLGGVRDCSPPHEAAGRTVRAERTYTNLRNGALVIDDPDNARKLTETGDGGDGRASAAVNPYAVEPNPV